MKFSLILATVNRISEVEIFCQSLAKQLYSNFELIIVDQNRGTELDLIVSKYSQLFSVIYVKTSEKGLSRARNIGLKHASGDWIAFPDDDCMYYPYTLNEVNQLALKNPTTDILAGRIIDMNGVDVIRKWKKKIFSINRFNYYHSICSVTIFTKMNPVFFDEKLGAGTQNGSCEDVDYIYTLLENGKTVKYFPSIEIWHPHQSDVDLPVGKIVSYGRGFGFFIRKHLNFFNFCFFLLILGYHSLKLIQYLLTFKIELMIKRYSYLKSRIKGFLNAN